MTTLFAPGLEKAGYQHDFELEADGNERAGWRRVHNTLMLGYQISWGQSRSLAGNKDLRPVGGSGRAVCFRHIVHSSWKPSGSVFERLDSLVEDNQESVFRRDSRLEAPRKGGLPREECHGHTKQCCH